MNTMKVNLNIAALAVFAVTNMAWADDATNFVDRAQVLSATPIYQQVNVPRQECWTETAGRYSNSGERSYGGAILGGLVGGLLGNTVGQGNGRIAAAAVGAATGAVMGDKMANNNAGYNQPQQVERCTERDDYHQEIAGYNVVYRYQGRTMTAVLPQDPGRYVNVNVNIALADNRRDARQRYDERGGY